MINIDHGLPKGEIVSVIFWCFNWQTHDISFKCVVKTLCKNVRVYSYSSIVPTWT